MKKTTRLLSLFLALALMLTPFAQALTLEDAKGLLQEHYIAELPKAAKDAQTIQDLIAALGDPYTEYFTAQQYQGFLGSMQDSTIVGIGVRFHMTPEGGLVEQVYVGSAAHGAGVVAGDLITEVNRTSIVGKTVEEVQPLLAGDVGSALSLTVRKPDGIPQALTLTRTNFTVPTTDSDLIDGHIGSLVCHSFGKETYQHFQDAIVANDAAADRWIVDLRDNGGGEMQAAVDAASAFAGGGQLMFLRDGKGEYAAYEAAGHALTIDPAIVLIGSYTASAAELFAATVRDRQAGVLIGSRTYGKGVAQVLLDKTSHPALFPDGDALKITAYRAFSEGNVTHDQMGVLPHIMVPPALAQDVAYLLSASRPSGDSTGFLRVHVGRHRLYVNLKTAASEQYLPALTALLHGLPPDTAVYFGTGDSNWEQQPVVSLTATYTKDYVNTGFTDIGSTKYEKAIGALGTFGIVSGSGDGTFLPDAPLNRASLCALLAKAMGYPETPGKSTFSDVPEDAWYTPYVNTLVNMGIVNGWDDGLFHPNATMDHQQFMVLLSRTTQRISHLAYAYAAAGVPDEVLKSPNYAKYDAWAVPAVAAGDKFYYDAAQNIDPHAPTTRGEAAASLYTMLTSLNILTA